MNDPWLGVEPYPGMLVQRVKKTLVPYHGERFIGEMLEGRIYRIKEVTVANETFNGDGTRFQHDPILSARFYEFRAFIGPDELTLNLSSFVPHEKKIKIGRGRS